MEHYHLQTLVFLGSSAIGFTVTHLVDEVRPAVVRQAEDVHDDTDFTLVVGFHLMNE